LLGTSCSLLIAFLAAGGEAPPAPTAPAPNAHPHPPAAAAAADDVRTVVGQIVSVDLAHRTVVVGESVQSNRPKGDLKGTLTVTLDDATQLLRGKRAATAAELKPKDHVVVRYVETPRGARAVSFRIADLVTRTPVPAASAAAVSGSGGSN
jgi:hypothetical protein